MISVFDIKNFRRINRASIDLAPVNIITGSNNVGKTSILEALFLLLAGHDPKKVMTINALRGLRTVRLGDEVWQYIFRGMDSSSPIYLQMKDDRLATSSLTISQQPSLSLSEEDSVIESSTGQQEIRSSSGTHTLSYRFESSDGPSHILNMRADLGDVRVDRFVPPAFPDSFFLTPTNMDTKNMVTRFSGIKQRRDDEDLVRALRVLEPELTRLEISYIPEIVNIVADIGLESMIPIQMLGGGFNHVLNVLSTVAEAKNGVTLVDDLDFGLHHTVLEKFWHSLLETSLKYNSQIVGTTQSRECIAALARAIRNLEDGSRVRLHRVDRVGDDTKVVTYEAGDIEAAVSMDVEVR